MKQFKMFAPIFLSLLGIAAFSKNENDVLALTDEQKQDLTTKGWEAEFLSQFNAALAVDFAETAEQTAETAPAQVADLSTLNNTAIALSQAQSQLSALQNDKNALQSDKDNLQQRVNNLTAQVETLSKAPEADAGNGAQQPNQNMKTQFNLNDDKQLGGMEGAMWSLERPYNVRARAALLAREGKGLGIIPIQSALDFTALEADLGAYYRNQSNKQLMSFVTPTKDVSTILPLVSNVQDREIITNLFLGEFSQSDNSDSDFEKIVKGKYEIQPEEIRMYDVMSTPKFSKLKELEKQWIGYLNTQGSSSIKLSFIEYLLARTTEQLFNEQQRRRIRGVRKNPTVDVPGSAMEASTGLYRYVAEKVNGLQIKPFDLGEITAANIGEKVYNGTKQIPQDILDRGDIALYMPQEMVTEYHKYNETHYGGNMDYKADIMFVKEYPNVEIIPVPHAHNHRRLIWTPKGNIKTFENVPGEMTTYRLTIKEFSINVVSQWKEGVAAVMVGKKWSRVQDMDYDHQMVFCTAADLATTSYEPIAQDDATPSALFHSSLVSVANTALTTITNIDDAEVGKLITLKCGSDAYGIKITKAANFSTIASDWTPGVGDVIVLFKRADGKFMEYSRTAATPNTLTFAADATAPSVDGGNYFTTNANTAATAITNLDDAVEGQTYTIYGAGSTNASTIANSGNFTLTAAMTLSAGKEIVLLAAPSGKFVEISRV